MQEKSRRLCLCNEFLLYCILLFSSGFYFSSANGTVAIGASLLAAILVFTINGKGQRISLKVLLTVLVLIIWSLISSAFAGDSMKDIGIATSGLAIACIIVVSFSPKELIEYYIGVMRKIATFSLISHLLALVLPDIILMFPKLTNYAGYSAYFMGGTIVRISSTIRNQGIFWEPGAYQTYLAFAFLLELYYVKGSKRNWHLILYYIAIVSTLSTTGFAVLSLLTFLWIVQVNERKHFRYFGIILVTLMIAAVLGLLYEYFPSYIQHATYGKVLRFFDSNTWDDSAKVRQDSINYPTQAFLSSPIIGVGISGLQSLSAYTGHSMLTFTPLNWFARYGVLFGAIIMAGFAKLSISVVQNGGWKKWIVFAVFMLCLSTEAYTMNSSICMFSFVGFYACPVHKAAGGVSFENC